MVKKKKESPEEIETRVNAEEAGGISPEEAVIIKAARASLSEAENSCLTDMVRARCTLCTHLLLCLVVHISTPIHPFPTP